MTTSPTPILRNLGYLRSAKFGAFIVVDSLPTTGVHVLELGFGTVLPVASDLTALGHHVVGVDGLTQQISRTG